MKFKERKKSDIRLLSRNKEEYSVVIYCIMYWYTTVLHFFSIIDFYLFGYDSNTNVFRLSCYNDIICKLL